MSEKDYEAAMLLSSMLLSTLTAAHAMPVCRRHRPGKAGIQDN
jgi:hypothetical protein